MKKIEHSILIFILIEALFTLLFFKLNYIELLLGFTLGIIFILISNLIPKNALFKIRIFISSIILSGYFLIKISKYINYNILPNHSIVIIAVSFLLLSLYLIKKGYHAFIKTVEITSYIYFFIKLISFLLILPKLSFNNINNIPINVVSYRFIYFSFFICFIYNSVYYISNNKPSIKILIVSFLNILFIKTITILTLGNSLTNIYSYPYLNVFKKIKYLDFIERCDGIISFEYLICFYILLSFVLLNTKLLYKKT